MKHIKTLLQIILGLFVLFAAFSVTADEIKDVKKEPASKPASQSKKTSEAQSEKTIVSSKPIIYKPPPQSAPNGRVGGGTRAPGAGSASVLVVAPDHTGVTVQEQPDLYWYLSAPCNQSIEVTLLDDKGTEPILNLTMASPIEAGIQRVRLRDYGVRLKPGIEYQWFVVIIVDPEKRSKDVLSGGLIKRVDLSAELASELSHSGKELTPHVYANAGVWYEAVSTLSDMIETFPNDPTPRNQRASLLEEVGLPEAAEYDKQFVRTK